MTITAVYQSTLQMLEAAGYDGDEARATARILLDSITGLSQVHLIRAQNSLSSEEQAHWQQALAELQRGRPLAYVLGEWGFYGLKFKCDERALIPRPETELLLDAVKHIVHQEPHNSQLNIADLGTGTGCIAITLAKQFAQAEVYATDLSAGALELARENARLHDVAGRIRFLTGVDGDWALPLLQGGKQFDVVVSNPPYIAPRDIEQLQTQVRDFEPRLALDGGEDGLDCYRQIASQCRVLLRDAGVVCCELGAGQFKEVRTIFENHGWTVQSPLKDFAGIDRVLVAHTK